MVQIDIEKFRKLFPNLAREILDGEGKGIRFHIIRPRKPDPWRGYMPTVYDFIRRAKTIEEALEVVDYMERRGEITKEEAEKIRKQLKEKGLESFGPRREPGYYFKEAGYELYTPEDEEE